MSVIQSLSTIINTLQDKSVKSLASLLRKESRNIFYKEDVDSKRLLIYLAFLEDTNNITQLERECRSVILDSTTLKVISYSMDELYSEDEVLVTKLKDVPHKIYECVEGTLLSVYYFNDKWNVSTRRCLDASKSTWLSQKSHYDLMMECVSDKFFEVLDKNRNYYFVLQHHENKGVVDYSKRYGEQYKRLVLLCVRDKETHSEVSDDVKVLLDNGVKSVDEYTDLSLLEKENNVENILDGVEYEGLLIKMETDGVIKYLRLATPRYNKRSEILPNAQNKYVSYLKLYQNGTLREHIKYFPENGVINHPSKPITYDTVGMVDSCMQVVVKELYNLFKMLYDLKHGEQKNKELYELLPVSYHEALYAIKGIFYRKRVEHKMNKVKSHKLTEKDIYHLVKSYSCNQLVFLLRGRKMLRDEIVKNRKTNKKYYTLDNISFDCDIKQMLLTTMYLNYMFN
jgi:hypothetical protein